MAISRVTDVQALINQQIEIGEKLDTCLSKAEALTIAALVEDFCLLPKKTMQYYFWLLQDTLEHAIKINDDALRKLFHL